MAAAEHATLSFALHPNRRTHAARLSVFLDALVERFGPDPDADGFAPAPAP